jgi:hypothetical protein
MYAGTTLAIERRISESGSGRLPAPDRTIRFSLRTLFLAVSGFCVALSLYSGGYMHGVADERRQNVASEAMMQELIRLRHWWQHEHPDQPLPAVAPPGD